MEDTIKKPHGLQRIYDLGKECHELHLILAKTVITSRKKKERKA